MNVAEKINIRGITSEQVTTLGTTECNIFNKLAKFHVVGPDFPIGANGILGTEFLNGTCNVLYTKNQLEINGQSIPFSNSEHAKLPARTSVVIPVNVLNQEISEGIVPRLNIAPGVYTGDAIVTHTQGRAYIRAINTSERDIDFLIPHVELMEFNIRGESSNDLYEPPVSSESKETLVKSSNINESFESITFNANRVTEATELKPVTSIFSLNADSVTVANEHKPITPILLTNFANSSDKDRYSEILELLRLEHLNCEESESVKPLIQQNSDLFFLPGDKLEKTNLITHKIQTSDEIPINVKQYRYPLIHKEEINKQIKELLENEIIKHSKSPYNSPLWVVPKKSDSHGNKRWRMVIDYRSLNEKSIADA